MLYTKSKNSKKIMKHDSTIIGVVTVNDKGQVVIPAGVRADTDINPGDKLLVMMHPSHAGFLLIKPDGLESYANKMLEQLNDAKNLDKTEK